MIETTFKFGGVEFTARGHYEPGLPEVGPAYGHGGIPATPPDIEDMEVGLVFANGRYYLAEFHDLAREELLAKSVLDQARAALLSAAHEEGE